MREEVGEVGEGGMSDCEGAPCAEAPEGSVEDVLAVLGGLLGGGRCEAQWHSLCSCRMCIRRGVVRGDCVVDGAGWGWSWEGVVFVVGVVEVR